jgi:hypothetical protein
VAARKLDLYDYRHGNYVIGSQVGRPDVTFFVGRSDD